MSLIPEYRLENLIFLANTPFPNEWKEILKHYVPPTWSPKSNGTLNRTIITTESSTGIAKFNSLLDFVMVNNIICLNFVYGIESTFYQHLAYIAHYIHNIIKENHSSYEIANLVQYKMFIYTTLNITNIKETETFLKVTKTKLENTLPQPMYEFRFDFEFTPDYIRKILCCIPTLNSTTGQSTPSLFGQQTSSQQSTPLFGQTTTGQQTTPLFGQQTTPSLFGQQTTGQTTTGQSTPLFGQQTTGQQTTGQSTPLFGQTTTGQQTTPLFGQTTTGQQTTPLFGQTTTGQQTTPLFGQTTTFGQTTGQSTTPSLFGQTTFGQTTGQSTTPSLFGQTTFGQTTGQSTTPSLFVVQTTGQTTPLFGGQSTNGQSTPLFGQQTTGQTTPLFGGQSTNCQSTPLFGQQTTGQTTQSSNGQTTPLFGHSFVQFGQQPSGQKQTNPSVSVWKTSP
jgi:hypothetical protein